MNNDVSNGTSVVHGKVIFDEKYAIKSADENYYRFASPVVRFVTESIHLIDIDDFYEVVGQLKEYSTSTIVMRMRRFDNAYRWVVAQIHKFALPDDPAKLFAEMDVCDVINLHDYYAALEAERDKDSRHITYLSTGSFDEFVQSAETYQLGHKTEQMVFYLVEIDNYDKFVEEYGEEFGNELRDNLVDQIYMALGNIGFIAHDDNGLIYFYITNLGNETNVRSYVEALRNQLQWRYISKNRNMDVKFSIGISEYPRNGRSVDIVIAKMKRAHELAVEKGRGRYIIYKEELHGDISE